MEAPSDPVYKQRSLTQALLWFSCQLSKTGGTSSTLSVKTPPVICLMAKLNATQGIWECTTSAPRISSWWNLLFSTLNKVLMRFLLSPYLTQLLKEVRDTFTPWKLIMHRACSHWELNSCSTIIQSMTWSITRWLFYPLNLLYKIIWYLNPCLKLATRWSSLAQS